jgi:hypothetical protein
MGGTVSEPDWETQLRTQLKNLSRLYPEAMGIESVASALVRHHIDAAYQRGLIAGRSQQGYATRRKKKEEQCSPTAAPSAGPPSPASSTEEGG